MNHSTVQLMIRMPEIYYFQFQQYSEKIILHKNLKSCYYINIINQSAHSPGTAALKHEQQQKQQLNTKNREMKKFIDWLFWKNRDSFIQNGQLSTNQFTLAGDHLCSVCQNWKWSPSLNPKHSCTTLDANKQFLINERAVCAKRIGELKEQLQNPNDQSHDIVFLQQDKDPNEKQIQKADIRYYNMYIVYDEYYHCPRMFFTATDGDGKTISNERIREDITKEYLDGTLTVEKFPFIDKAMMFTVNPSKHSIVMKMISDTLRENNKPADSRLALIIFLKFIVSVIPLVEFDSGPQIEF